LIALADDFVPCPKWDIELLAVIPDADGQYVVDVSTGRADGLLTLSILTRAYYLRYGRIFYSDYDERGTMYNDDDFTAVARRDAVVIDARRLWFEHRHPSYGKGDWDDTYRRVNREEAYRHGAAVFKWRSEHDFADAPKGFTYK
jgi:hypothetical protein